VKTLIVILIIASFLESAILPLNLVLIILIARALIRPEKDNLYLSFAFGLLISHLSLKPLGSISLIYLILILITESLSKVRLAAHPLLIVPLSFLLLSLNLVIGALITHQSVHLMPQVFIESILSLPIFYFLRIWEERFIVRKEVKLKL